jgi:hypothetical protein
LLRCVSPLPSSAIEIDADVKNQIVLALRVERHHFRQRRPNSGNPPPYNNQR